MRLTLYAVALATGLITVILPRSAEAEVFLWPQPQQLLWSECGPITLSSKFTIQTPDHRELQAAARRYRKLIYNERWIPVQAPVHQTRNKTGQEEAVTLTTLKLFVTDLTLDLQHGVDESYEIVVSCDSGNGNAILSAESPWGAMRGLETFSQVVRRKSHHASSLIIEHGFVLQDNPNFPHRGILLDTSRSFYPVRDILRSIRALSYNKLNVLHLHISDAQSFPLELHSEPELASKGSYGPGYTYSPSAIKFIVSYARNYGVRVIPELDMPGHTGSWAAAYPEIVTCADKFWLPPGSNWEERYAAEPGTGQLNPLKSKTYEVVKNVVDEVSTLFRDEFYHAGGDELAPNCWNDSQDVRSYLSANPNHTLSDLLASFVNKTRSYITNQNRTVVYWEDVLLNAAINVSESLLPQSSTIMQTWNNGPANTKLLTSAGYRTIVSSYDFYYLDCGHGGWVGNDSRYDSYNTGDTFNYGGNGGSYCAPFKTWARIYNYDITTNLTDAEAALVIGGEVALWSEQADSTVLDARLWPRTSALAETLWSGNRDPDTGSKRYADALNRLNDWRFRLVMRGIAAEPLQPLWCLTHPNFCNLEI